MPGLGHVLQGERARGVTALAIVAGLALMVAVMFLTPGLPVLPGWIALGLAVVSELVVAWDAFRCAARRESASARIERRTNRDPWKALLLSNLLAGVGQCYTRHWLLGLFLLVLAGLSQIRDTTPFKIAASLVGIVACLDVALRFRGARTLDRRRALVYVVALVAAGVLPALATFAVRATFVQAYRQPGPGMSPTLREGERFFVDRTSRGHAAVGDVVVFRVPGQRGSEFAKRVFARAGDVVEFRADGAWRNGHREVAPPVVQPASLQAVASEGAPLTVPAGMVFVTGDNWLNSLDSRTFGPIPEREIRGRAYKVYSPPGREHALDRPFPAR